ncbi:hypothetical protein B0H13DRAFT_2439608 [Mycena leptocephala]|nr:hypothetical protein B0H13DRAFT_2439608 [Mycena leptocephala]
MPRQSGQTDCAAPSATSDAPTLPTTGDAVWLHPDEKSLIEYLLDNQAAAGDNGNLRQGGPKTSKSCEQKYRVLRKFWGFVDVIKGVSGWTWSDKEGVSVTPATQGTWDAWVAKNKQAARFENKGWPFYDLMAPLMPQKAKGSNVFRAGAASSEREKSQSPNWDYSQMDRDFGEGEGDGDGGMMVRKQVAVVLGVTLEMMTTILSSSPMPSNTQRRVPAAPYRKKPRMSAGAQGLFDLNATAGEFTEIMGSFRDLWATGPTNETAASTSTPAFMTSPQRRTNAVNLRKKKNGSRLRSVSHSSGFYAMSPRQMCTLHSTPTTCAFHGSLMS